MTKILKLIRTKDELSRVSLPLPKLCGFDDMVRVMMQSEHNHAMEYFVSFTNKVLEDEHQAVRRLRRDLTYLNKTLKTPYAMELWFEYSKAYRLHCHAIIYGPPSVKPHFNKIAHTYGTQHYVKPITDLQKYRSYCRDYNNTDKIVTMYPPILHYISQAKPAPREGDTNH